MGMFVKAEICSEPAGSCDGVDCNAVCSGKHLGGAGKCDQTNSCNCYYNCPGKRNSPLAALAVTPNDEFCTAALGKCDDECTEVCCIHNCAFLYKGGAGHCDLVRGGFKVCYCDYPCHHIPGGPPLSI